MQKRGNSCLPSFCRAELDARPLSCQRFHASTAWPGSLVGAKPETRHRSTLQFEDLWVAHATLLRQQTILSITCATVTAAAEPEDINHSPIDSNSEIFNLKFLVKFIPQPDGRPMFLNGGHLTVTNLIQCKTKTNVPYLNGLYKHRCKKTSSV